MIRSQRVTFLSSFANLKKDLSNKHFEKMVKYLGAAAL